MAMVHVRDQVWMGHQTCPAEGQHRPHMGFSQKPPEPRLVWRELGLTPLPRANLCKPARAKVPLPAPLPPLPTHLPVQKASWAPAWHWACEPWHSRPAAPHPGRAGQTGPVTPGREGHPLSICCPGRRPEPGVALASFGPGWEATLGHWQGGESDMQGLWGWPSFSEGTLLKGGLLRCPGGPSYPTLNRPYSVWGRLKPLAWVVVVVGVITH